MTRRHLLGHETPCAGFCNLYKARAFHRLQKFPPLQNRERKRTCRQASSKYLSLSLSLYAMGRRKPRTATHVPDKPSVSTVPVNSGLNQAREPTSSEEKNCKESQGRGKRDFLAAVALQVQGCPAPTRPGRDLSTQVRSPTSAPAPVLDSIRRQRGNEMSNYPGYTESIHAVEYPSGPADSQGPLQRPLTPHCCVSGSPLEGITPLYQSVAGTQKHPRPCPENMGLTARISKSKSVVNPKHQNTSLPLPETYSKTILGQGSSPENQATAELSTHSDPTMKQTFLAHARSGLPSRTAMGPHEIFQDEDPRNLAENMHSSHNNASIVPLKKRPTPLPSFSAFLERLGFQSNGSTDDIDASVPARAHESLQSLTEGIKHGMRKVREPVLRTLVGSGRQCFPSADGNMNGGDLKIREEQRTAQGCQDEPVLESPAGSFAPPEKKRVFRGAPEPIPKRNKLSLACCGRTGDVHPELQDFDPATEHEMCGQEPANPGSQSPKSPVAGPDSQLLHPSSRSNSPLLRAAREGEKYYLSLGDNDLNQHRFGLGVEIVRSSQITPGQVRQGKKMPGGACIRTAACFMIGGTPDEVIRLIQQELFATQLRDEKYQVVEIYLKPRVYEHVSLLNGNPKPRDKACSLVTSRICGTIADVLHAHYFRKIMEMLGTLARKKAGLQQTLAEIKEKCRRSDEEIRRLEGIIRNRKQKLP